MSPHYTEPPCVSMRADHAIIHRLVSDIKFAVRMLFRTPAFSLAAVIVLALGLGATTAIFYVSGTPDPRSLCRIPDSARPRLDQKVFRPVQALAFAACSSSISMKSAANRESSKKSAGPSEGTLECDRCRGEPVRLEGARVTSDFFPMLGIEPLHGRLFAPEEYHAGTRHGGSLQLLRSGKAVSARIRISSALRCISMDGASFEIIGVMPRGFKPTGDADLWAPLSGGIALYRAAIPHLGAGSRPVRV